MPPTETNNVDTNNIEHSNKLIFIIIGIILIIGLVYFFAVYQKSSSRLYGVEKIDFNNAESDSGKLPKDFPSDIPIEIANITDSYSVNYKKDGFIQRSVVYTSTKTVGEIYGEYETFMVGGGYLLLDSSLSKNSANIEGSKNGDNLSVSIDDSSGFSSVNVSYVGK